MPRLSRSVDGEGFTRYTYNGKTFFASKVSRVQIRGKWYQARRNAARNVEVKVPVFDRDVWIDVINFSTQIDNIAIRQYGQAPAFLLA